MSGKDRPSLSTSSESLLLTVKRKLAWALCTDLLIPPIVPVGALVVDPDDSGESNMQVSLIVMLLVTVLLCLW